MLSHCLDALFLLTHLSPKRIEYCYGSVAVYISTTDIYGIYINFHLCKFYRQMVNQYFQVLYFLTSFCCSLPWPCLFSLDSLIITFFRLAFWFRWWQASTSLEYTVTPVSLKVFKTVSSKLLFEILSGIHNISRHSCPECESPECGSVSPN